MYEMSKAPKNKPILAYCHHQSGVDEQEKQGYLLLTTYMAHSEYWGHPDNGWYVIEFGGECDDPDGYIADWWFLQNTDFESPVYPIVWVPLPNVKMKDGYPTFPYRQPQIIDSFQGHHRFLSNFAPCEIYFDDDFYPSVEHAYVAAKTLDKDHRQMIKKMSAGDAKKFGRNKIVLRSDWEEVKIGLMKAFLGQKFNPFNWHCADLVKKLNETEDAILIEGNTWGDTFWGVCDGVGENHLGKLLMEIREKNRRFL